MTLSSAARPGGAVYRAGRRGYCLRRLALKPSGDNTGFTTQLEKPDFDRDNDAMITIESPHLSLTEFTEKDIPVLYAWRNTEDYIENCTNRAPLQTIEEFRLEMERDFARSRHLQMMIRKKSEDAPSGTIYSYHYNEVDQYAYITVYVTPEYRNSGIGLNAFFHFGMYLFNELGLYKIYFDVYEYNQRMLDILDQFNFGLEGVLKKQHLLNGQRYDIFRYAIYPSDEGQYRELLG